MVTDPTSPLLDVVAVSLAALAEHAPSEAVGALELLTQSSHVAVRQQVAQALGWNRGPRSTLLPGEIGVLDRLAVDSDVYTRSCVVRAAQRLAPHHPDAAIRLLGEVPFADAATVADEVFQTIGARGNLDWRQLSGTTMNKLLAELELCPSIEGYWVEAFLAELSAMAPTELVEFLQRRVTRWEQTEAPAEYRPLPFNWRHGLCVRDSKDFVPTLRRIRDWMAASPDSWQRQHAGAKLFAAVANSFDESVMRVLEEGAAAGVVAQMTAIASILRQVPRTFVFENVEFVQRLLALAAQVGERHVERVGGALSAAAVSGVRMGVPGQPFAEDVDQRDRARAIADSLPDESPERRLYRSLQASAESNIKWHAH